MDETLICSCLAAAVKEPNSTTLANTDMRFSRSIIPVSYTHLKLTSRVLLICDATHALPIQVLRNDIRVIAAGNGCTDDLQLEHLPANTDIRVGDVLVTSGLGGRFPEGYPVAVVSSVKLDTQRAYTVIQARPTAGLQRLRYLLLLWGADRNGANPVSYTHL